MKRFNLLSPLAPVLISTFLFALLIWTPMKAQSSMPDGWQPTQNWLNTFKTTLGHDACPSWMLQQMELEEETELFTNKKQNGFVMVQKTEAMDASEIEAEMEMAFTADNGTFLAMIGEVEFRVDLGYTATFRGTISGAAAQATVWWIPSENGDSSTRIIAIAADDLQFENANVTGEAIAQIITIVEPDLMLAQQ